MLRLLLAVGFVCVAQAHATGSVTSQHTRLLQALGDATKALQAAEQSLEDALPSPVLTSVSVVQDWSLVCKELCGAGLGVAPCASHCGNSVVEQATRILNAGFDLAKCEQLTGLQNDTACSDTLQSYGKRLCSSYCKQRHATLSGCSSCPLLDGSENDVGSWRQSATTPGAREVVKMAEQQPRVGVAQITATAAIDAAASEDTPDWDEMCKTLCKTGDGGSLCKCDLSPFFT